MKKKLFPLLLCIVTLLTALAPCAAAFVHGDADLDGVLSSADARQVLRTSVGLKQEESFLIPIVDCDNDGALTAADARTILRASVLLEEIPCRSFLSFATENGIRQICTVCTKERAAAPEIPAQPVTPEQTPIITPTAVASSVWSNADHISQRYQATAVQAAVIDNGQVSGLYRYGWAKLSPRTAVSDDTKFRVASLSKLAVAMVFMALADRGYVSDRTDIGQYLGSSVRNPYFPYDSITAEMIFTHTGSFDDDGFYTYNLAGLNTSYSDLYNYYRPDTRYQYSNLAYGLLWCACEKVTGLPFDALAKQYLFDPLGIDAAFSASNIRAQSELGALYGEDGGLSVQAWMNKKPLSQLGTTLALACGNLGVSAKDYGKLIGVLLNSGKAPDGTQILSQNSVNTICRTHFQVPLYGVGYGTQIETTVLPGKTVLVHTGSAYGMFAAYAFCPAEKKGVMVLTTGCNRSLDEPTDVYHVCLDMIRTLYPF